MLLQIPQVLSKEQVLNCRRILDSASWVDGKVTAGHQSAKAKNNMQIPENSASAKELREIVLTALEKNPLFISAALPLRVFPPLFNRYSGGQNFGTHIDNAIRYIPGTGNPIRTDLSATLFLAEPDEYEGGELVIEDNYGIHKVKLAAGDMILYPSTSLHHVTEVTKGARVASFFWIQSMIRDDAKRTLLFDLDNAIRSSLAANPNHPSSIQMTGIYHNLLRMWSEV
ncbi:MAG: Fe2+-dependent dioxygenase [Pseudomonadota bacterium]